MKVGSFIFAVTAGRWHNVRVNQQLDDVRNAAVDGVTGGWNLSYVKKG